MDENLDINTRVSKLEDTMKRHKHKDYDLTAKLDAESFPSPLPIENGGTGETTRTAAFDALAPASPSKGDIIVFNGVDWVKLAAGADNSILTAASSSGTGLAYSDPTYKLLSIGRNITVSNTTTPTTLFNYALPASTLNATNCIRVTLDLIFTNATDTFELDFYYGNTYFAGISVGSLFIGQPVWVHFLLSQGSDNQHQDVTIDWLQSRNNPTTLLYNKGGGLDAFNADSTTALGIKVVATFTAASVNDNCTLKKYIIEKLN